HILCHPGGHWGTPVTTGHPQNQQPPSAPARVQRTPRGPPRRRRRETHDYRILRELSRAGQPRIQLPRGGRRLPTPARHGQRVVGRSATTCRHLFDRCRLPQSPARRPLFRSVFLLGGAVVPRSEERRVGTEGGWW